MGQPEPLEPQAAGQHRETGAGHTSKPDQGQGHFPRPLPMGREQPEGQVRLPAILVEHGQRMDPFPLEQPPEHGEQFGPALGEPRPAAGLGQSGRQRALGRAGQDGLQGFADRDSLRLHLRQTGDGSQAQEG